MNNIFGRYSLEEVKLRLEVVALAAALVGASAWTLTWSGKSPEMRLTLSASQAGNVVLITSDIEVSKVNFKIDQVIIKVGESYRIWARKKSTDITLIERIQTPSKVATSEGNMEPGSCDLAAAQILNRSGGITAGDKRTVQCHVPFEWGESSNCVPVVLRLIGKRAFPINVPWISGEFFSMAEACSTDSL